MAAKANSETGVAPVQKKHAPGQWRASLAAVSFVALSARLLMYVIPISVLFVAMLEPVCGALRLGPYAGGGYAQPLGLELAPDLAYASSLFAFFGLVWFLAAYFARMLAQSQRRDGENEAAAKRQGG